MDFAAARRAPDTSAWAHEVRFDGWRIQLHIGGHRVHVFSKNAYVVLEQEMSE